MTDQQIITERELRRKLDLLVRTGCVLIESMADTARIMRNLKRVEAYLGLPEENTHINVKFNMLMVNLSDEEHSFSKFQRVDHHAISFDKMAAVSKLSWRAIQEDYSLDRYEEELEKINHMPRLYTDWQVAVGSGFACGGFCIQFGCDWPAFFIASIAAALAFRVRMALNHRGSNGYMNIAVSAFIATFLAWLMSTVLIQPTVASALPSWLVTDTPWHPLMACALFIVPGVPLINFVSDMLCGHIEVGLIRALNVLLILVAMSFGIAVAIYFCGIDNFVKDLSMTPHNHSFVSFAVAAGISGIGFSMIYQTSPRMLWVVGLGAIIAVCTRNFVNLGPSSGNVGLDMGLRWGSFIGSATISLIATRAMHWFHVPHQCIAIPSVIPMIPGVLMYRGLFAFIEMHGVVGEVTTAMYNTINASLVILFISLGVAIPNIFVRRLTTPASKKKLVDMIKDRRIRRGEMVDLSEI
jgi:uncharacterized membrane protein YjjP (DUF1212 family)